MFHGNASLVSRENISRGFYWKQGLDKSIENEQIYKNYKHLFEKLRKKAKQTYYQSSLKDYNMEDNEKNHKKKQT